MNCIKKIAYVCALLLMTTGAARGMDIFQAAATGNIGRIEELLANGADINQRDNNDNTALHVAAEYGQEATVLRLIQTGARVNKRNYCDKTALHLAVEKGYEAIIGMLIEAGACVNQQDAYGRTALHLAVRNIMAETRVNPQEMPWAGRLHREAIVCRLIKAGTDINQQDDDGKTAVDIAVELRQHTIVTLLNDYIQRMEQARQRVPVIAHTLALVTNGRLSAASPLALLPQDLLHDITHLAKQAEEMDARRPRQAHGAAVI